MTRSEKYAIGSLFILALLALVLVSPGCATDGTGARTDPQTGTNTVGAQTARDQAGATYVIKSEGTVYNIDTDGAPESQEAVQAIAKSLLAFDSTLAGLQAKLDTLDPASPKYESMLEAIKDVTAMKTEFMKQAKGAFGVAITIQNHSSPGAGASTVDTAGTTGQANQVPPIPEPEPPE